jgi:PAS domain-containing protein
LEDLVDAHTGIAELETADESGQITGPVGVITARARAEETLRQSETRFRNIVDASPVPCAFNDEQQNITCLNPAFICTFGYDLDDIFTLADWWPKVYPDTA